MPKAAARSNFQFAWFDLEEMEMRPIWSAGDRQCCGAFNI